MVNNIPNGVVNSMSFSEVIMLVVAICSIFVGVIMIMQKSRNSLLQENLKTMWKRIDENKLKVESADKNLAKNYHDKDEVREYIRLSQEPYIGQIKHVNEKLDTLTKLVQTLVDKDK